MKLETFQDIDLDNLEELVKEPVKTEEPITEEQKKVEVPAKVEEVTEPIGIETPTWDEPPITEDPKNEEPAWEEDPEELLKKILFENNNDIEEAKKQATEEWNPELVQQLTELQNALEQERIARQRAEQSGKVKDDEMSKLVEQNTLLETENLQKKRIYWAMDEDSDLQAAVVYWIQAKNKPEEYKPKFIEALKTLLRREGIDLDALQQKAVVSEKAALTEWSQQVPAWWSGAKPSGSVMEMFESMD